MINEDKHCSILLYDDLLSKKYQIVEELEDFEEELHQHELSSNNKYVIFKTNGAFAGDAKAPSAKPRIHWGDLGKVSEELATIPYLIVATRYYCCHLGKCYYSTKLKQNRDSTKVVESAKKKYKKKINSKKVDCPASFQVKRLFVFPDHKIKTDGKSERARMGDNIRKNICNVKLQQWYLFCFPDSDEHSYHNEIEVIHKVPINKKVVEKINQLVYEGITEIMNVTETLEDFIEKELHMDMRDIHKSQRCFPSRKDLLRLIKVAKNKLKNCMTDEDEVALFAKQSEYDSDIYFKPSCQNNVDKPQTSKESRNCGFVFVYQNSEMRRLYRLYGHQCVLLDPTYRYCKFHFPLYFLVVQTNVNYLVIAIIIIQNETTEALKQALHMVVKWSPSIIPYYGLSDNRGEEVKALEEVFPGIKVFWGHCYLESSWKNYLNTKNMKNLNSQEVMIKLRRIVNAVSEEKAKQEVCDFKSWHVYNSHYNLRCYFEKLCLKDFKKWCSFCRPTDFYFECNDSINHLDVELRYDKVLSWRKLNLSQIIKNLCNYFIQECLEIYRRLNVAIMHRLPSNSLPEYLCQLPQWILNHILGVINVADEELCQCSYEQTDQLEFTISSIQDIAFHKIKFYFEGLKYRYFCSCFLFTKHKFICKHLVILSRVNPSYNLEKLSLWLFDDPICRVDNYCLRENLSVSLEGEVSAIQIEGAFANDDLSLGKEEKDTAVKNIKLQCRDSLKSLSNLINDLNPNTLLQFSEDLQLVCKRWMNNAATDDCHDKPNPEVNPLVKKIADFYSKKKTPDTRIKSWGRRGKKRKVSISGLKCEVTAISKEVVIMICDEENHSLTG